MVNENNYPGANVTVVGTAAGPYEVREIGQTGAQQAQISIAVSKGYRNKTTNEWVDQGTDWYTLTSSVAHAEENFVGISKGDTVRVDDAKLTLRTFLKKDGTAGVDAKLQFGYVTIVKKKEQTESAIPVPF